MPKENIHVIIRFRPNNKREIKETKQANLQDKPPLFQNNESQRIGALEIIGNKSSTPHNFTFDHILDSTSTQLDTFQTVAQHVCDDILDGYNGCLFAYGQTGSGVCSKYINKLYNNYHMKVMDNKYLENIYNVWTRG